MPKFGRTKLRDLVNRLKELGWNGPNPGGKHPYMEKDGRKVTIPNPHGTDIGVNLLKRILEQAEITKEEWEGE